MRNDRLQRGETIDMNNLRNGEWAKRRNTWWGEAPERPDDLTGAAGGLLPTSVDTPKHAPSRGLALHHGSARFQAYRHFLARIIGGSDSTVRLFGSLAPPSLSPTRLLAVPPP